ncbi:hypothetical protein J6590_027943 [Homalodisca vitripennis]|nr:hypothetical protein J6590_027943 [Homalodisca vitripennis]
MLEVSQFTRAFLSRPVYCVARHEAVTGQASYHLESGPVGLKGPQPVAFDGHLMLLFLHHLPEHLVALDKSLGRSQQSSPRALLHTSALERFLPPCFHRLMGLLAFQPFFASIIQSLWLFAVMGLRPDDQMVRESCVEVSTLVPRSLGVAISPQLYGVVIDEAVSIFRDVTIEEAAIIQISWQGGAGSAHPCPLTAATTQLGRDVRGYTCLAACRKKLQKTTN